MPAANAIKLVITTLAHSKKDDGFTRVAFVTKNVLRGSGDGMLRQMLQQCVKAGAGTWYDGSFFKKRGEDDIFDLIEGQGDDRDDDELAWGDLSAMSQLETLVQLKTEDVIEQLKHLFAGVCFCCAWALMCCIALPSKA